MWISGVLAECDIGNWEMLEASAKQWTRLNRITSASQAGRHFYDGYDPYHGTSVRVEDGPEQLDSWHNVIRMDVFLFLVLPHKACLQLLAYYFLDSYSYRAAFPLGQT